MSNAWQLLYVLYSCFLVNAYVLYRLVDGVCVVYVVCVVFCWRCCCVWCVLLVFVVFGVCVVFVV